MGVGGTHCTPNELLQGRLFLYSRSMNNGDERQLGLEMMLSSREQPTGSCQSQGGSRHWVHPQLQAQAPC